MPAANVADHEDGRTLARTGAARLSKAYVTFMRSQKTNGNGVRKVVQPRASWSPPDSIFFSKPKRTGNRSLFYLLRDSTPRLRVEN